LCVERLGQLRQGIQHRRQEAADELVGGFELTGRYRLRGGAVAARFSDKRPGGAAGKSYEKAPIETLSDRELEVFKLLGRGMTAREAAKTLSISVKTVQTHCAKIKQKLNRSTATELLMEAFLWRDQNTNWPNPPV